MARAATRNKHGSEPLQSQRHGSLLACEIGLNSLYSNDDHRAALAPEGKLTVCWPC
jgi:hypothetical protein